MRSFLELKREMVILVPIQEATDDLWLYQLPKFTELLFSGEVAGEAVWLDFVIEEHNFDVGKGARCDASAVTHRV